MTLPHPSTAAFAAMARTHGIAPARHPTLGQQVKVYRLALGLTQVQLAERAGIAQPRVDEVEQGANVTAARLCGLAKALGVALVVLPEAEAPEPKPRAR